MTIRRAAPLGLVSAFLLMLSACTLRAPDTPTFARDDCQVHAVVNAATGEALRGIEDLAQENAQTLILSAYDRPAVEAALGEGRPPPEGGLYRVAIAPLLQGATRATPLLQPGSVTGGLRPHGIALAGDRLAAVNRRLGASGELDPVVLELRLAPGGDAQVTAIHKASGFCALNDVAFDGELILATLDRASCGRPGLADLFPGAATGKLAEIGPEGTRIVAQGFAFANGVAVLPDALVAVAETRGKTVRLADGRQLEVPGAPDNLSVADDGRIVAALQPSLLRFALWRYGWLAGAGSRIIALDPATGALETLFEDPSGDLFAGATSALLLDDALVAGSVLSAGLLVCRKGKPPRP